MAAPHPNQETRPLKKPRLGPPDVYPQDPKQREDELTSTSVKHGFSNMPSFSDEYGSLVVLDRALNINADKFGSFFSSILSKKAEINMFQDTAKKKQQMIRDHFWAVLPRTRNSMESWFKDLAGSKPLSQLSKKVPLFVKKEEIFSTLCEFSIPMVKAAWFIKMTAAHNAAVQENKTKKRQNIDQSIEWTQALCKFLKDQILKIQEHYHGGSGGPSGTSFLTATQAPSQVDLDSALKQGHYCCKLARHMYDEGLLDRQEFLSWLIELLEKMKQPDDTVLKFIMEQVLQYLDEITLSAHLSRRLAHFCAKKLAQMCYDSGCTSPRTQSPMLTSNGSGTMASENTNQLVQQNPVAAIFMEYNKCPQHRSIIQSLSAVLQVVTLLCPTALIWNSLGDGKSSLMLCGSPLDLLPCAPSSLPMPPSSQNAQIRMQIQSAEHQIKLRGRAAEVRWSSDKCQQSTTGFTISKVLCVLDILDRHNFDKVESNSSLDSLYNKIFSINQNKEGNEPMVGDEPILNLLIDWAVSTHRTGRHRGVVVAKLLEKRQNEMRSEKFADPELLDDKESVGSDTMAPTGLPAFQSLLLDFLDYRAPVLADNYTEENKQAFDNLIQLFSELIRHDVFSHDAYLCTLISRGDLVSLPTVSMPLGDSIDVSSVKSQIESMKNEPADDYKVEMDIQTIDSDLGSLFGTVKEEQKSSPEAPASVASIKSEREQPIPSVGPMSMSMSLSVPMDQPLPVQPPKGPSRHMLFATHFPIPQEEMSAHECNQRMIVLYGVGKARDEARHIVKKIGKEILKLFSKRNCIDTSSGDLGKPKKKKEKDGGEITNMDMILNKFQKLSYHDQHTVTWQCATSVIDQISSFAAGNSSYLPLVDNISNLMDLLEFAHNINGLLEFSIQILRELRAIEQQLIEQKSNLAGNYTPHLCLCIVGIFREYHAYLMVSQDLTMQAFEGLMSVIKHVDPTDCTSAERCVLAHLYDVYTSCSYLKTRFSDIFSGPYSKMKETVYADICPSASNLLWEPTFMADFISNVKCQPDASLIKQLNDKPANRYSFVCNAMLDICNSQGTDRLNEISLLCAELTSRCNSLSSEWLGVLKALCCSSNHSCGFIDVLTQYDVSDLSIHDSLAVFTALLIARHCFSLQDLVVHVALPSLLAACPSTGGNADAEPGARLTCHLLLRLFKTSHLAVSAQSLSFGGKSSFAIKASCDRHLLEATHDSITVGAVLAVLKAMLVLGDSCSDDLRAKQSSTMKKADSGEDLFESLLKGLEDDVDMDLMLGTTKSKGGMETAGLSDYAKHALKEMCGQEWVREKFLKDPNSLFTQDLLLDSMLTSKQAQQLLQMICYLNGIPNRIDDGEEENKQAIQRILYSLDQWSLRVSLLELQLMFKQANTQSETNSILDNIARGTVELFHQQTETSRNMTENGIPSDDQTSQESYRDSIWLVAPLISKLPSAVQGRVLKLAGQVLENGNNFLSKGRPDKESKQRNKSLLSHQPFLSLVLTCLKGQDEQREGLLSSLHMQLEKFISNCKEILDKHPEENKIRQDIHEAIQLRLSLVGGMFDTIQRNTSNTTDWALLLVQLITGGVVDVQTNLELFTTILDMLSVLIHGTLMPDSEKGEENKRTYLTLIKKIKRDIGDKHSESLDKLRQLLPLPKRVYEVILCDLHRSSTEKYKKNNPSYNSARKKQGLKVGRKELISSWEVIEGFKNPPPLSWTFFNAVKVERKTLKYEEEHRVQFYHTHCLTRSLSHYLDPPPLPKEDLEPPPDKINDEKPQEQIDTRVNEPGKKKKPKKRAASSRNHSPAYMPQTTSMRSIPYHDNMYQPQQNGWFGPPQPQPPAPYYSQQLPPAPTRYSNFINSKQNLQTFLRSRQPPTSSNYPMNTPQHQMMYPKNSQLLRQQILRRQRGQQVEQTGMFSTPMQQSGQQPMMHSINQQAGMSQNYNSYNGMQPPQQQNMMEPVNPAVMQPGYSQSYQQQGQNPSMMQQIPQQQYMAQQQPPPPPPPQSQVTQQQYNPVQSRLQHTIGNTNGMQNPNTQMNTMPQSMPNYNQMGPSGPPQPAPTYMPQMSAPPPQPSPQRMQQLRQQQQMMAMQKQQMQQQTSQRQTAALVAQLQRQMSGGPPPPGPQYNTYPQPPQYQ